MARTCFLSIDLSASALSSKMWSTSIVNQDHYPETIATFKNLAHEEILPRYLRPRFKDYLVHQPHRRKWAKRTTTSFFEQLCMQKPRHQKQYKGEEGRKVRNYCRKRHHTVGYIHDILSSFPINEFFGEVKFDIQKMQWKVEELGWDKFTVLPKIQQAETSFPRGVLETQARMWLRNNRHKGHDEKPGLGLLFAEN